MVAFSRIALRGRFVAADGAAIRPHAALTGIPGAGAARVRLTARWHPDSSGRLRCCWSGEASSPAPVPPH